MTTESYWAGKTVPDTQIQEWIETIHRDGYIFIPSFLPPDWVAELKADLESVLGDPDSGVIAKRLFETSKANLRLFDMEPIATLAETLIGKDCHVFHNNSFATPPGSQGISRWHQDDPPHYLVTHGEPPTNVRLPLVLFFTANYYLTDVTDPTNGPTEFIPGSHLFGSCPAYRDRRHQVGRSGGAMSGSGGAVWCCSITRCGIAARLITATARAPSRRHPTVDASSTACTSPS